MPYLTGDEVPKSRLKTVADICQMTLWPADTQPFLTEGDQADLPSDLCVLMGHITDKKLNALLALPIAFVMDNHAQDNSIKVFLAHQRHNRLNETFGLLLTCPIIYKCDIARIFTDALYQRLALSPARKEGIHTAVHEAIINGLVHGNLQLSSDLRQTALDFLDYARILKERLTDPAYANKSISIWATWNTTKLEIKIRDEGAGYALMTQQTQTIQTTDKSGRGIYLIAGTADSCTIDDFGREITLSFLLDEDENLNKQAPFLWQPHLSQTDLSHCKIVLIEDNPNNQTLIIKLLNVAGITQVITATDGIEGLQKIFKEQPDLIILDITMPKMNGYDVLHKLRQKPETSHIPVLVQTASDTRAARDRTFSAGATDFITKPINPLEFFSRVRVHLENRLLMKSMEDRLKQLEGELALAQTMQENLLPSVAELDEVRKNYQLDIAYQFSPTSRLGGDFWQLLPLSKHKLGLYICDFSGHGVGSALNTFRLHTLARQMDKVYKKPALFLYDLNNKLVKLLPRGQFCTFFFGIIDNNAHTLTYAGASSPFPLFVQEGKMTYLDTSGLPLGITEHTQYPEKTIAFGPTDRLFLFSDSLIEQPNSAGERLGYKEFLKLTRSCYHKNTAQEVLTSVIGKFYTYSDVPIFDDITAVFVRGMG